MVGSSRRRYIWITLVALAVAALLWVDAKEEAAPPAPEATPASAPATRAAPTAPDPPPQVPAEVEPPPAADSPPTAAPLPREQVELPSSPQAPDGGVPERDPASTEERRNDMMGTVLDQLNEDLRAAEEAGDDERATDLRIRIERLEARRRELAEP